MDMQSLVKKLDEKGRLVRIKKEVSTNLEIAGLMKKLDGKPVLFENVRESDYPVIANLAAGKDLVALALGVKVPELIPLLADAIDSPKPPETRQSEYRELETDLTKLPILTHYPKDGGPYISSGVVVIEDPELGINASYHRMMVLGKDRMVARILDRHLKKFLERGNREFAICIGNPTSVQISAAISAEPGKSELDIANAIRETPLVELEGHKVPESQLVLIAELADEQAEEGPFVDLTETYDFVRKQPVFRIKKIFAKPDMVYHALLPGGLEHKTLMGMPREPTIFREVNKVCKCLDVLLTPGGCSWLHGAVKIRKENPEDGKKAIEAAFRGHSSMKHVVILDQDIDIYDPNQIEWSLATRFQADRDSVIKEPEPGSSLDPSSNPDNKNTAKTGLDATIPSGKDRKKFERVPEPDLDPEDYLE